jgi:hypothetical protein
MAADDRDARQDVAIDGLVHGLPRNAQLLGDDGQRLASGAQALDLLALVQLWLSSSEHRCGGRTGERVHSQ